MNVVTRSILEQREHQILSDNASFADESKPRKYPQQEDEQRTAFQRDRDRILHCKSFRRLAHKTQVFLAPENDHYRTRLLHTLEVTQIARSIARALALNEDLTEAIALGHDLGHTPFGHTGEGALSRAMACYRNEDFCQTKGKRLFEHNIQSARIVELLENNGEGLNLSPEVIDGIRCHSGSMKAQSFEGQIVGIADRIAYVTHDVDDAKRAGLLKEEDLPSSVRELLGSTSGERIATMVSDLVKTSADRQEISMSNKVFAAMMELRSYLFEHIYTKGDAKREEPKADAMIEMLFNYFIVHMDEVPDEYRIHSQDEPDRQVADYIAGMTDRYALRMFQDIFMPRAWHK